MGYNKTMLVRVLKFNRNEAIQKIAEALKNMSDDKLQRIEKITNEAHSKFFVEKSTDFGSYYIPMWLEEKFDQDFAWLQDDAERSDTERSDVENFVKERWQRYTIDQYTYRMYEDCLFFLNCEDVEEFEQQKYAVEHTIGDNAENAKANFLRRYAKYRLVTS